MKISHVNTSNAGYFTAVEDGKEIGLMTYSWKDSAHINILQTKVDTAYRGKGIAKDLVMEGVKYARENKLKITPMCSYVRALFEKDASLEDVKA